MEAPTWARAGARVAVVAVCATAALGWPATGAAKRPNIVVVMTDDQSLSSMGAMSHVRSQLAKKGATFTDNVTNWALCCPSRATFYSGQYAHNHGVIGNTAPLGGFPSFRDGDALPVWLRRAGYRTIHVGKYLNGYGTGGRSPTYVPPGWSRWYAATGVSSQQVYDYTLNQNGSLVGYGSSAADFKQDVFTRIAVDEIKRSAAHKPFFLGVMYTAPHLAGPNPSSRAPFNCADAPQPAMRHATAFDDKPLPQPPNFDEADVTDKPAVIQGLPELGPPEFATIQRKHRCRLESLLSVDEGVDRIVGALRKAHELDDTLLIFTSDNGIFEGEHRVQGGKNRVYEEAIHVPLVIRGPGVPKGVKVDDPSINADLAPTIADAAGAKVKAVLDGRSLLPFAAHPSRRHGRELLIEEAGVGDDEDSVNGVGFSAVRTSRYIYVANDTGEVELYDLEADPYELTNLHGRPDYAAVEGALATRLAPLRGCRGASCKTKPSLRLKLPRAARHRRGSCRRAAGFVAQVRGRASSAVEKVTFRVGSKLAGRDESEPLRERINRRLLRGKRRPEIRATAETIDGRVLSLQRRVRICR